MSYVLDKFITKIQKNEGVTIGFSVTGLKKFWSDVMGGVCLSVARASFYHIFCGIGFATTVFKA